MAGVKEFVQLAFIRNRWILLHALGGIVFAGIFVIVGVGDFLTLFCVLLIAVQWELIEFAYYGPTEIRKIYGSMRNFIYDSIGDIIAALIGAILVIILV